MNWIKDLNNRNRMLKLTIWLIIVIVLWILVAFFLITETTYIALLCIATFIILLVSFGKSSELTTTVKILAIILSFQITFGFISISIDKDEIEKSKKGIEYLGVYKNKDKILGYRRGPNYYLYYYYKDNNDVEQVAEIKVDKEIFNSSRFDTLQVAIITSAYFQKTQPNSFDIKKHIHPVLFATKEVELGNDSYEYAIYEPMRAYENFGLNIVYKSQRTDAKYIYFYDILKNEQKIEDNTIRDTFLVYSNINPKYFDGWHICSEKITTPENIAKIDSAGYGYLFRGKIYSAAETEKYWNIIEQYKLRQ